MPTARRALALLLAVCLDRALATGAARAQSLELSSDTAITLKGVVVGPGVPVRDDGATVTLTPLGPSAPGISLPTGANLDGFDRLPNGDVLFSTDVPVAVPGLAAPGIAAPGDVVKVTATGPVLVFSAAAAGLSPGANVDAVSSELSGELLLSFDTAVSFGGLVVEDEDVVQINPTTFAARLIYDGSAQGVAPGLDLDGVYRDPDTGRLLLSFDGSGTLGGVTFSPRDVLDWDPSSGAYAIAYDGAAEGWPNGAVLDEVSGFPLNSDGDPTPNIFDNCDYVSNPSQSDLGGVGTGSPADGIGDVCQCGEVNGDGRVQPNDLAAIRAGLTGSTGGLTAPERCNVSGGVSAALLPTGMRADCDVVDVAVIARALAALKPSISQVCQSALP